MYWTVKVSQTVIILIKISQLFSNPSYHDLKMTLAYVILTSNEICLSPTQCIFFGKKFPQLDPGGSNCEHIFTKIEIFNFRGGANSEHRLNCGRIR